MKEEESLYYENRAVWPSKISKMEQDSMTSEEVARLLADIIDIITDRNVESIKQFIYQW
jgi:hypothetical protein